MRMLSAPEPFFHALIDGKRIRPTVAWVPGILDEDTAYCAACGTAAG